MTEDRVPSDLDPNQDPLWGSKEKPSRHPRRPHERVLPPVPLPPGVEELTIFPEYPPRRPDRVVDVKGTIVKNPTPKEHPMTDVRSVSDLTDVAHARTDDPQTSHEAAGATSLRRGQVYVLETFQAQEARKTSWNREADFWGMTDEEMVAEVLRTFRGSKAPSPSGLRTARAELVRAGLVESTGRRRPTVLGNDADVYALTEAGRRFHLPER